MNLKKMTLGVVFVLWFTSGAAAHTAETNGITLEYSNRWRISGKADNMLTLTHTEKPGDVLLSVTWVPLNGSGSDAIRLYRKQLETFGALLRDMPSGDVAGQKTTRFMSNLPNDPDVYVINDVFTIRGRLYLVTVSAQEEDLIGYAWEAQPVLESMKLEGEFVQVEGLLAGAGELPGKDRGIVERATGFVREAVGEVVNIVKSMVEEVKRLIGFSREEPKAKKVVCNPPYIRHDRGCCLDKNVNNICDNDE